MKDVRYKKGLVLGILILFIGTGVIPSISGYTGKMNIQSTNEVPTNFPLNNDYVNSYWKFDDCSGTTLSDSSGHGYDGTIYGATWTTGGYSGCALDFDGVDDYVDLGPHSAEILFNKTDDVIFSFYFKSTGEGIIFSATASWGFNPAFTIELLSNGSLFFNPWTQNCGIKHYSSEGLNDGDWHHAEYYFNGITSNPTVWLYVDGVFNGSVTKWLCGIDSSHYAKTKIGMHAHTSSDYFDGVIDEFKIIKYEQGNEQVPPTIDGPTVGEPNVKYDFTFITEDLEGDNISLYIDWEDDDPDEWIGPYESGEEVIVSHEWDEDGNYSITAKSMDIWDDSTWSDPYVVKIGNQPPYPPTIDGPTVGDPGEELTYTFVTEDPEGHDIYYYIEWGDGTYDDWFGPFPSGQEVTATHSWDSNGDYDIRARAKDIPGSVGDWSELYQIRIGDEPPDAPDIVGPAGGSAGTSYTYKFTSTDMDGDKISYYIKWGDGAETDWTAFQASGTFYTESHTWDEQGTYTIEAKAKDTYGAESGWSEYIVTMPRNRVFNLNLLELLLERFPNAFPIIRHLLGL